MKASTKDRNKYTFHVVGLPHTQTTKEYTHCAYTQKVRKFCNMMSSLGHDVYLYSSEDNEAIVKEHVCVITKDKQHDIFGETQRPNDFFNITWGVYDPGWVEMNKNAIVEIAQRIKPRDFICIISGICQEVIARAFPDNMSVEYGIGYLGTFARYRVFESYAHMHYVHGQDRDDNGSFYDTVIPNYYDIEEFPFSEMTDNYYVYLGRLIDRKGWRIAQEVCQKLNKRLIVAGQGTFSGYGEYRGVIGVRERAELLSNAKAVFVPSTYLEPFGGVHAESLLCGTPVITTNFGVFSETVTNGKNGYRCDTFSDFIAAVHATEHISNAKRASIQRAAQKRYSTAAVAKQYEEYFHRLYNLWGDGWYAQ